MTAEELRQYAGVWHIVEMEMWDASYINLEGQGYLEIQPGGRGTFHFGVVYAGIDSSLEQIGGKELFFFTFEGNAEYDPISGAGWLQLHDDETLAGWFKFHDGDHSAFTARRAEQDRKG